MTIPANCTRCTARLDSDGKVQSEYVLTFNDAKGNSIEIQGRSASDLSQTLRVGKVYDVQIGNDETPKLKEKE